MKETVRVNPDGSITVGIIEGEQKETPAAAPKKAPAKKKTK